MPYPLGDDAMCSGKKVFRSFWAATRSARTLNKNYAAAKGNVYRCSNCHFWHVGNTLKKSPKRTPSRHTLKDIARHERI